MIGVMTSGQALTIAQRDGLDLVEIAPNTKPSTCKIMDYGKWKFENKKKEKQAQKNQKKVLLKEIQLRPRTDVGDVNIKLQKAREFLNSGHKVRMNLRFFGREIAHKELGFELLKSIENRLADIAIVEKPAQMERRVLFTIFSPIGSSVISKHKSQNSEASKHKSQNSEASKQ